MKNRKIKNYFFLIIILACVSLSCMIYFAHAANCPGTCRGVCNSDEGTLGGYGVGGGYKDNCSFGQVCCVPSSSNANSNKCPGTCRGACNDDEDILRGFAGNCGYTETCCVTNASVSSAFGGGSSVPGAGGKTGGAYQNQEKIPGAGTTSNFVDYIKQIIRFGFAAIGILALFMISVGAYQYLMAAGNLAKVESAKGTIYSALFGLILGLTAFLILRTINPQLVSLQLTSPGGGTGGTGTGISGDKGTNYGNGNCVEVGSGPCSPENLAGTFGSAANQASIICNVESAGNQMKPSKSDLCQDGRSFSWGLFQINLTAHKIGGLDCPSAFSGKNSACTVVNESLYQQCVQIAQDPTTNINFAKSLYAQNGWGDWKRTRTTCGL